MSGQHSFEEPGKVKPKPKVEDAAPQKAEGPVTASEMGGKLNASTLLRMQQTFGNAAVQRFLAQRSGEAVPEVDAEMENSINSKKGAGQALDENVAATAEAAMGHDFSDVNIHTDAESDQLNQQLDAKAFTTGSDIFFLSDNYDPESSDGQHLIYHELAHVVQQSGGTPSQGRMTVTEANDAHEVEADSVADSVMAMADREETEAAKLQRAVEEEEMPPAQLKREGEEEELPPAQLKREGEEEELPIQPERAVEEEEELPPAQLKRQRQPEEEEEPAPQLKQQRQDDDELV